MAEIWVLSSQDRVFRDNIGNTIFREDFVNQDMPIDVVYTWVNGSDDKFLSELYETKHKLERQLGKDQLTCANLETCFNSNFLIIYPTVSEWFDLEGLLGISRLPLR
jgi:hypothetical protein